MPRLIGSSAGASHGIGMACSGGRNGVEKEQWPHSVPAIDGVSGWELGCRTGPDRGTPEMCGAAGVDLPVRQARSRRVRG